MISQTARQAMETARAALDAAIEQWEREFAVAGAPAPTDAERAALEALRAAELGVAAAGARLGGPGK